MTNPKTDEERLIEWAARECRYDPLKFVLEGLPWGIEGSILENAALDDWQREYLIDLGKEVERAEREGGPVRFAVASGHGIGKTFIVAMAIWWYVSTRPRCVGTVTANTERQLTNRTWREVGKWKPYIITGHWFSLEKTKLEHKDDPTWFVAAIPWSENNSEAFAGQHERYTFMIFDEGSAIADVIYEVASGAMTTPGAMWLVFGNPTRPQGWFHKIFTKLKHRWKTRSIDARTAKMADRAYLQELIDDFGLDSDYVRVRVLGQFPRSASNQFIGSDIVQAAQERKLADRDYDRFQIVLGVDVARFGDDRTVLAWRQGPKVIRIEKYVDNDITATIGIVRAALEDKACRVASCFIDEVGVGAGVVDGLRSAGFDVQGVNGSWRTSFPSIHVNKRMDLWKDMRDWLKTADIPAGDDQLADDLTTPEYHFRNSRQMQLERKEDMKRRGADSPDCADALSMTFFAPNYAVVNDDDIRDAREDAMDGGGRDEITGY